MRCYHIGDYLAFNVEFQIGIEIPIGRYIWGTPINVEVESGSHTYFKIDLEVYINMEITVDVYNKNLCKLKKEVFDAELTIDDIPQQNLDEYHTLAEVYKALKNIYPSSSYLHSEYSILHDLYSSEDGQKACILI